MTIELTVDDLDTIYDALGAAGREYKKKLADIESLGNYLEDMEKESAVCEGGREV